MASESNDFCVGFFSFFGADTMSSASSALKSAKLSNDFCAVFFGAASVGAVRLTGDGSLPGGATFAWLDADTLS